MREILSHALNDVQVQGAEKSPSAIACRRQALREV
jgi:hypothetical protein